MAVVREHQRGCEAAVSPGLLYAGAWRRYNWKGITTVEKVKAHQEEYAKLLMAPESSQASEPQQITAIFIPVRNVDR